MRSLQRRFRGVGVAIRSQGGELDIGKFRVDLMGSGSALFYCARTAHLALSVQFLGLMGFRGTTDDGKSVEIPTIVVHTGGYDTNAHLPKAWQLPGRPVWAFHFFVADCVDRFVLQLFGQREHLP